MNSAALVKILANDWLNSSDFPLRTPTVNGLSTKVVNPQPTPNQVRNWLARSLSAGRHGFGDLIAILRSAPETPLHFDREILESCAVADGFPSVLLWFHVSEAFRVITDWFGLTAHTTPNSKFNALKQHLRSERDPDARTGVTDRELTFYICLGDAISVQLQTRDSETGEEFLSEPLGTDVKAIRANFERLVRQDLDVRGDIIRVRRGDPRPIHPDAPADSDKHSKPPRPGWYYWKPPVGNTQPPKLMQLISEKALAHSGSADLFDSFKYQYALSVTMNEQYKDSEIQFMGSKPSYAGGWGKGFKLAMTVDGTRYRTIVKFPYSEAVNELTIFEEDGKTPIAFTPRQLSSISQAIIVEFGVAYLLLEAELNESAGGLFVEWVDGEKHLLFLNHMLVSNQANLNQISTLKLKHLDPEAWKKSLVVPDGEFYLCWVTHSAKVSSFAIVRNPKTNDITAPQDALDVSVLGRFASKEAAYVFMHRILHEKTLTLYRGERSRFDGWESEIVADYGIGMCYPEDDYEDYPF